MTEFDALSKHAGFDPAETGRWRPGLRESFLFDRNAIHEIQRMAREGIYDIRGFGAKRRVPHFDDLLFLGASVSRYPLEGYRESCGTDVTLGGRFASRPIQLEIPITIAGMSFGALSAQAKEALGRGASAVGTSTTTGDGGMLPEERDHSNTLVYQLLPSRYGMNPDDLRRADAVEVVVGQGAKPGGGGMLLGQKISDRVAEMRDLPKGIDQRSACRHPDWTGPDDLEIKIQELREITDWEKPIYVKIGATRTYFDVALAVKAGADVIVLDGMEGGTAASQEVFIEHVGIPILAALPEAVRSLQELDMHRKVQLIVSGGIRSGADVAKALALGADAVSIGVAALVALGDNSPAHEQEYEAIGTSAGFYDDWHEGQDPVGISTQDAELARRFDPALGGRRLANYLRAMVLEAQTLARACGKSHVHNLEPEDMVALTVEAAAMSKVPLAGTDWVPGELLRPTMASTPKEARKMAKVLCVLYDDPVDGYPPAYARDDVPTIERYFDGQTDADPGGDRLHPGRAARLRLGRARAARSSSRTAGTRLVVTSDKDGPDSVFERELPEAEVVISQPFWPAYLTAERIAKAPNLKLAITAGIGSDHVDLAGRDDRRDHGRRGHLLELDQRLRARGDDDPRAGPQLHPLVPDRRRRRLEHRRRVSRCYDLEGMQVGTVAAGRIGSAVLRRLKPFEVGLHYTDRHRLPPEVEEELGVTYHADAAVDGPRTATWSRSTRRFTPRPSTSSTTRCSGG